MEVLVKSGGYAPEKDYSWKLWSPGTGEVVPSGGDGFLADFRVDDLFDDRSPSVVLARRDRTLLLLVTRLEAVQRKDFRGRPIRNMVAWRCREDEEGEIRSLAVYALNQPRELQRRVDEAVQQDDDDASGYRVDWKRLREVGGEPVGQGLPAPDDECLFAIDSEEMRSDLARQLARSKLPPRDGPLVVVTGNLGEDLLAGRGVWRGLSSRGSHEGWQPAQKKTTHRGDASRGRLVLACVVLSSLLFAGMAAIWASGLLTGLSGRKSPEVTSITAQGVHPLPREVVACWTKGGEEKWRITRPKGEARMAVEFDVAMDVAVTPSVLTSLDSVIVDAGSWSAEGTAFSFRIALPEEATGKGLAFTLRVSGARNADGVAMRPLEVAVEVVAP